MEPVKITDMKEWSSIDIFLFSNGQQYSPPRKYHLRSEELQWWGTTMSYLGRTHYGSGHSSIELYTIDGKKINGPLELVNGAAYVAVEPPDSFINTGYEDYLLRASRSWEKRLAQKSYNTQLSNLDLKCEKNATQEDIDHLNTPENITNTASLKVASNTSPQKARPNKPYPRLQRKSITSPGQIQKKKSCDTHSSILKRICAETDKIIPCPKKAPLKKNGFMNQRPSINVPRNRNETTNQVLSSCCKKRDSIKPESNPTIEPTKNLNACETVPREPQIVDLFKNDEPESVSVKNENDTYALTENAMHRNGQINLTQDSVIVLKDFAPKTETGIAQDVEKCSLNNLKQTNVNEQSGIPKKYYLNNEIEKDRSDNIPLNTNKNKENKSYDTLFNNKSEKQVIDEYVAQMNKGGFLLLKLKVKLKDCKTIFNRDKAKNVSAAISLSNLPKTEKTSQVDINISFSGELLKSNDQQNGQDKSLQSILNKLCLEETYNQIDNKKPRIIILQCACRNYSDNHKYCMCDTVQGNKAEDGKPNVTMNHKLNETFTGCEYQNQSLRISKDENIMKNETIIQPSKGSNENRPSVCNNGFRVKELAQKFEKCDKAMSNDKNTNNNIKENYNNTSKNENQRHSVVLTKLIGIPVLDKDTDHKEEENNNSKSVCNKSTQTEWCNLLLEARLQEDTYFTFHLPSLYMLKQYNL